MVTSLRRTRDSQRIRVYRANSGVLGAPLPHMNDVYDFSNEVVNSVLWQTLFTDKSKWVVPKLKPGRGARTAHVLWHDDGRIEIAFPKAYRFATYVLHELAHYGIGYRNDIAAHGPEFAGIWLTLVREFCSTKTVNALEKACAREKVRLFIPVFGETHFDHVIDLEQREDTRKQEKPSRDLTLNQLSLFH